MIDLLVCAECGRKPDLVPLPYGFITQQGGVETTEAMFCSLQHLADWTQRRAAEIRAAGGS